MIFCNYLNNASKYMLLLSFEETSFLIIDKTTVMNVAAQLGYINILKLLKNIGYQWNELTSKSACLGGQLETLKWLKDQGCKCDSKCYRAAGRIGNIDIINWLDEQDIEYKNDCVQGAVKCGQMNILEWYYNSGVIFSLVPIYKAIKYKQYEILEWIILHKSRWYHKPDNIFEYAASLGDIKIFEILKKHYFPWGLKCCLISIKKGHLEAAKWLVQNGCPYDIKFKSILYVN